MIAFVTVSGKPPLLLIITAHPLLAASKLVLPNGSSHLEHTTDILVFLSPLGIKSLFENFPDFKQNKTLIAVYGNTTEEAAKAKDLRIDIKAPTEVSPSMAMAIEKYIKS